MLVAPPPFGRIPLPPLEVPVLAAPMAGGPSTPELVAAVCEGGGTGFLAGGYRSAEDLRDQVHRTRGLTSRPFGVNVFVPTPETDEGQRLAEETAVAAYADLLQAEADRAGVELPAPNWHDTDSWSAKIALLISDPVPLVSFTFGTPGREVVEGLHDVGSCVLVTVTNRAEARASVAQGADVLVAQGCEAGGHRGTHRVIDTPNKLDHVALLALLADLGVPVVAAGGVTTGFDTRRALDHGAVGVQAGTAFLLADEAATSPTYREALVDHEADATITRCFSGRPARGLRNRFVDDFDEFAPAVYPVVDQLTKPLRAHAGREHDRGGVSLWAGAGWRAADRAPAVDILARLAPV